MTKPLYTPYDNATKPFSIGLSALDPNDWIEPDGDLNTFLIEKHRLLSEHFDQIFCPEETTSGAAGVLDIIVDHLLTARRCLQAREEDILHFAGRRVDLVDQTTILRF